MLEGNHQFSFPLDDPLNMLVDWIDRDDTFGFDLNFDRSAWNSLLLKNRDPKLLYNLEGRRSHLNHEAFLAIAAPFPTRSVPLIEPTKMTDLSNNLLTHQAISLKPIRSISNHKAASPLEAARISLDSTNYRPIAQAVTISLNEDASRLNPFLIASDIDNADTLSDQSLTQNQSESMINHHHGTFAFDPLNHFQFIHSGESRDIVFHDVAIDDRGTNHATSDPKTVTVNPPLAFTEPIFFHTLNQSIGTRGKAVVVEPALPFIGLQWNNSQSIPLIQPNVLIPEVRDPFLGMVLIPEVRTPQVSVSSSSHGKVGLQPRFRLTSGDIDAELPLELSLLLEQEQVSAGRKVTLQSGFTLGDQAFFQTLSPNIELGLDFVFNLETSASLQIGQTAYPIFDAFNISETEELVDFSARDFRFDLDFGNFGNLEGGLPVIETQATRQEVNTLSSFGEDQILTANLDLDGIATALTGGSPLEGAFTQDLGIGTLEVNYNIFDADLVGQVTLNQTLDLEIQDLIGTLHLENGDEVSFQVGQDLAFTVPNDFDQNNNGVLDFTSTLALEASLLNQMNLGFDFDLILEGLSAELGLNFVDAINNVGIEDIFVALEPLFQEDVSLFGDNPLVSVYENDFSLQGFNQERFNGGHGVTDPFSWWPQANLWLEEGIISSQPWQDYNPNDRTFVVTHGFADSVLVLESGRNEFQDLGSAIHDYFAEPVNIILWEWSDQAGRSLLDYPNSAPNVVEVGYDLAAFLIDIDADPQQTDLMGHSLGAHVMGNTGETYHSITGNAIQNIIAMDAAGPGFETGESFLDQPTFRLDAGDGQRVSALHTSNTLGYDDPLADLDLFVNWSDLFQPGQSNFIGNHSYAVQLLTELLTGASFPQGTGNPQENNTTLVGNHFEGSDIYDATLVGLDYVETQLV